MERGADILGLSWTRASYLLKGAVLTVVLSVGAAAFAGTSDAKGGRMDNQLADQMNAVRHFDIEAQDIPGALLQFGEQAELTVMVHHNANGNTPGLKGEYLTNEALQQLLAGTGLEYRIKDEAIIVTRLVAELTREPQTTRPPLLRRLGTAIASAIFATSGVGAIAADEADETDETDEEEFIIEEIIVTAEKRDENVLDVPLTMSAFSGEVIEELGMTNGADLEKHVPGLQIGENHHIVMRGIWTEDAKQTHGDKAVATYVDGVYQTDPYALSPNYFDLERVEVARGPQGTMKGRNALGGAISFFHKRPSDTRDSEVLIELTDQFTQRYNAAFGGPLSDELSFRITAGYYEGDGAQKNLGSGGDYDAPDQYSLAPQLRYRTDRIDVNARYQHVRDTGAPEVQVFMGNPPTDQPSAWPAWIQYDVVNPASRDCPEVTLERIDPPVQALGANITGALAQLAVRSVDIASGVNLEGLSQISDAYDVYGETHGICSDPRNEVLANEPGVMDNARDRVVLRVDFDLTENLLLRYTFGNGDSSSDTSSDGDRTSRVASATDPTIASDAPAPFRDIRADSLYEDDEISHELLLISNFDGSLNLVAGLYHSEIDTRYDVKNTDNAAPVLSIAELNARGAAARPWGLNIGRDFDGCQHMIETLISTFFGDPEWPQSWYCEESTPLGTNFTRFLSEAHAESSAVFVNMEYLVDEHWRLSAGLRHTRDEKSQGTHDFWEYRDFFGIGVPVWHHTFNPAGTIRQGEGFSFTYHDSDIPVEWKGNIGHVTVEYTPSQDLLAYLRISSGYKAPGFAEFAGAADLGRWWVKVKEEKVTNYEVGLKGVFLDNRLQLTSGVFVDDYEDYQVNAYKLRPLVLPTHESPYQQYTSNIDSTGIWGAEVEATYYVDDSWRLSGFYSYLGSSVGAHQALFCCDSEGTYIYYTFLADFGTWTDILPTLRQVDGNELPQQPKHKASVIVTHHLPPMRHGQVKLLGSYSWVGERWIDIGNVKGRAIPDHGRLDLRGTWTSVDEQWSVTLYVQNVLDEIGYQEFTDWNSGNRSLHYLANLTDPRRLGVQVRWRP